MVVKANNNMRKPGIRGQAAANRRKVFIATILVVVMAFMWIRVFMSDKVGPENANASQEEMVESENVVQSDKVVLKYCELPVIQGRHDCLANELFGSKKWCQSAEQAGDGNIAVTSEGSDGLMHKDLLAEIAKEIKIDAILVGQSRSDSEVFMKDKILRAGSSFDVTHKGQQYTLTVDEIHKDKVVLKWNELTVAIRMSLENELSK